MGGSIRGAITKKEKVIQIIQESRRNNWREDMLRAEKELENLLTDDEIYWRHELGRIDSSGGIETLSGFTSERVKEGEITELLG